MSGFDAIVVGAGPGGSSAAWKIASQGGRVLLIDKERFPREKTCGDGITPRAVKLLTGMGLGKSLDRFHRVDEVRLFARNRLALQIKWPERPGYPRHGYVIPRTDFDHMLVKHASKAGAEILTDADVVQLLSDGSRVTGVRAKVNGKENQITAPLTVIATGAQSRLLTPMGVRESNDSMAAVAIRVEVQSAREEDAGLEAYFELRERGLLPGYSWVFPMGGGKLNIGVGLGTGYPSWRSVNLLHLMRSFWETRPREWQLPSFENIGQRIRGWRVPLGMSVWPPWRPGVLAVGDAAGVAKPISGSGISRAIESGLFAANACMDALSQGSPDDLSAYERTLSDAYRRHYALGRELVRFFSRHPRAMASMAWVGTELAGAAPTLFKLGYDITEEAGRGFGTRGARILQRVLGLAAESSNRRRDRREASVERSPTS